MSRTSDLKKMERRYSLDDLARRQEALRVEIRRQRRGLLGLVVELRRVDEALRRIDRPVKPVADDVRLATQLIAESGGIAHLVVECFADKPKALTSRDIAWTVAGRLGLDVENRAVMNYLTQRVCTGLWTLKQSGALSKMGKIRGSLQLWECNQPNT